MVSSVVTSTFKWYLNIINFINFISLTTCVVNGNPTDSAEIVSSVTGRVIRVQFKQNIVDNWTKEYS